MIALLIVAIVVAVGWLDHVWHERGPGVDQLIEADLGILGRATGDVDGAPDPATWGHVHGMLCEKCESWSEIGCETIALTYSHLGWTAQAHCPACTRIIRDAISHADADIVRRFGAHVASEPADSVEAWVNRWTA